MKQKSLVFLLFALLMSANVMAQSSSYVSTLKEFLSLTDNSSTDHEKMKTTLQTINKTQFSHLSLSESDKLVDEYLNNQFDVDMYEKVLVPIFQRHASEEELRLQIALMKSDAGKLYTEHTNAASAAVGMALALSVMSTVMSELTEGEEDNSAIDELTKDCPKSYKELFDKYYAASKMEQMMGSVMNSLVSAMSEKMDDKNIIEKFAKSMKENLQPITMGCFYEIVTEDDLNFGIKMMTTPAGQHVQAATIEMSNDIMGLGTSIITNYTEWLKSKGIKAQ